MDYFWMDTCEIHNSDFFRGEELGGRGIVVDRLIFTVYLLYILNNINILCIKNMNKIKIK